MPIIPALGSPRQEDCHKFKDIRDQSQCTTARVMPWAVKRFAVTGLDYVVNSRPWVPSLPLKEKQNKREFSCQHEGWGWAGRAWGSWQFGIDPSIHTRGTGRVDWEALTQRWGHSWSRGTEPAHAATPELGDFLSSARKPRPRAMETCTGLA